MKLKEVILCTISAFVLMLAGGSSSPACAQSASAGSPAALQRWNSVEEISFTGTIHEVLTEPISNAPTGVNLTMDGSPSFQYASLGSQLNSSTKSELTPGQSVTLKGAVHSIGGQDFLIVRQLTIGQQTTQIRNAHGMLSPRVDAAAYQGNRPRGKNGINGGPQ